MKPRIFDLEATALSQVSPPAEEQELDRQQGARMIRRRLKPLLLAAKRHVEKGLFFHPGDASVHGMNAALRDIDECLEAVRNLAPQTAQAAGPQISVSQLIRGEIKRLQGLYESFHVQSHFDMDADAVFIPDPTTATVLAQSVHELLANAVEHSGVEEVFVGLRRLNSQSPLVNIVEVTVRDEGCGVDPSTAHGVAQIGDRTGLLEIQQLIESRGGSFTWESRKGRGTVARIRVVAAARANSSRETSPTQL